MTGPRRPNALTGWYPAAQFCTECRCTDGAHLADCSHLPADVRAAARNHVAPPGCQTVVTAPKEPSR